jgi:hypothetical protein
MKKLVAIFLVSFGILAAHSTASAGEDCIGFNNANTKVKKINNRWKIVDGNHWLFDFAGKKHEAKKTLKIIKKYGMNKSCFVGRPGPSLEYMLRGNAAPRGSLRGEDCIGFNRGNLKVKKFNNRWKIVDGNHWVFDFAGKKREALKSLSIIKKYKFNKSCFVGRPGPSFQYLRR